MINEDILLYIREQLRSGMSQATITNILVTQGGWKVADINEAFDLLQKPTTPVLPVQPIQPQPEVNIPVVKVISTPTGGGAPKVSTVNTTPEPVQVIPDLRPKSTAVPVTDIRPTPTQSQTPIRVIEPLQTPVVDTNASVSTKSSTPAFSGMQTNQVMEAHAKSAMGKKLLKAFLIIFIVGILGGGSAYGYFFIIKPSPERAMHTVFANLQKVKTGKFTVTLATTFNKNIVTGLVKLPDGLTPPESGLVPSENPNADATLTIDGQFDWTDATKHKQAELTTLKTSLAPLAVAFETRSIGDTFYAKVPDLGFLSDVIGTDLFGFQTGDWLKVSRADLVKIANDSPEFQVLPQIQDGGLTGQLTQIKQDKIIEAFINGSVVTPTTELPKSESNGISMHRYQFSLNQEGLRQALITSYEAVSGNQVLPSQLKPLDIMLASFDLTDGEIWVGMWDRKLYKIMFTVKLHDETLKNTLGDLEFVIDLSQIGTPVTITEPSSAKPFIGVLEDARKKGKDASIQDNIKGVHTLGELYYSQKRTFIGFCTAETGLKNTLAALTSLVAPGVPYCKDSARAYAVAAPLVTTTAFFCADNGGAETVLPSAPLGTVCK